MLCAGVWSISAAAQTTGDQFRPELGIYVQQGQLLRIEFVNGATLNETPRNWQGNFAFYVDTALKPVLRRELRNQPNLYRDRYLTFRAGYRHDTSLTNNYGTSENRGILELTSRYRLPLQLIISDRNRGEFRFIKGQSFSTRYRNQFRIDRDIQRGWFECTVYIYDEIFYDTRYGLWTPNRYGFGVQFPVGRHTVLEPYCFHQNSSRSNPPHINALGFKLNLYF